jgi:hypothetical protein
MDPDGGDVVEPLMAALRRKFPDATVLPRPPPSGARAVATYLLPCVRGIASYVAMQQCCDSLVAHVEQCAAYSVLIDVRPAQAVVSVFYT